MCPFSYHYICYSYTVCVCVQLLQSTVPVQSSLVQRLYTAKINGGHYITNYRGGNLRFKYRGVSDGTICNIRGHHCATRERDYLAEYYCEHGTHNVQNTHTYIDPKKEMMYGNE